MEQSDIGLIGLAVMGQNLVLNMNDHGYTVSVFNRTLTRTQEFMSTRAQGRSITGCQTLEELVKSLKRPRKIMLMVKAGEVVDRQIDALIPLLEPGDVIIDGGNSHFPDTARRRESLETRGILFIGTGISGGEEGARHGPSIMPGGDKNAWPLVRDIFRTIAAKTDSGEPCCDWVGEGGAGHYVKMVHNGIEYGDMQLICEAYQLMHSVLGLSADDMHKVFARWNAGELDSYLIEITADILKFKDKDGTPLVDRILDTAGQKGTGKWTGISALELGVPVTLIGESVFARALSTLKDERIAASAVLKGPQNAPVAGSTRERQNFIDDLENALLASKIISYTQGYMLMREAAREYGWNLNYGGIALMWRGGCIIRSAFLGEIKTAFDKDKALNNLLMADYFRKAMEHSQQSWRRIVSKAITSGIPVPAMSSALTFYDAYRSARLPANLLQAQRDYFGAHTYERIDAERGKFFHTDWVGSGGKVSAGTYNV